MQSAETALRGRVGLRDPDRGLDDRPPLEVLAPRLVVPTSAPEKPPSATVATAFCYVVARTRNVRTCSDAEQCARAYACTRHENADSVGPVRCGPWSVRCRGACRNHPWN